MFLRSLASGELPAGTAVWQVRYASSGLAWRLEPARVTGWRAHGRVRGGLVTIADPDGGRRRQVHSANAAPRGYCAPCDTLAALDSFGALVCPMCGAPALEPPTDAKLLRTLAPGVDAPRWVAEHLRAGGSQRDAYHRITDRDSDTWRTTLEALGLDWRYLPAPVWRLPDVHDRLSRLAQLGDLEGFRRLYEQHSAERAPWQAPTLEELRALRADLEATHASLAALLERVREDEADLAADEAAGIVRDATGMAVPRWHAEEPDPSTDDPIALLLRQLLGK